MRGENPLGPPGGGGELPEVETVRRELATLVAVRPLPQAWGDTPSGEVRGSGNRPGARIDAVERRGKYLLLSLDDRREIVVHLGMTGRAAAGPGRDRSVVRARRALDDGRVLELRDVRRFGRLGVVPAGEYASLPTWPAGPEPWDSALDEVASGAAEAQPARDQDAVSVAAAARGRRQHLRRRGALAGGHPPGPPDHHPREADRLLGELRTVLEQGIANGGTTLRDYRAVDGAPGRNQLELGCYGGPACPAALRHRAPAHGDRRPGHDALPDLPGLTPQLCAGFRSVCGRSPHRRCCSSGF